MNFVEPHQANFSAGHYAAAFTRVKQGLPSRPRSPSDQTSLFAVVPFSPSPSRSTVVYSKAKVILMLAGAVVDTERFIARLDGFTVGGSYTDLWTIQSGDAEERFWNLHQSSLPAKGGYGLATGGPLAWCLCYNHEMGPRQSYCNQDYLYPCSPGVDYYGRGVLPVYWNHNYGMIGDGLKIDLLNHPKYLEQNATTAFQAAMWRWMNPMKKKQPSAHDVFVGNWKPTKNDTVKKATWLRENHEHSLW